MLLNRPRLAPPAIHARTIMPPMERSEMWPRFATPIRVRGVKVGELEGLGDGGEVLAVEELARAGLGRAERVGGDDERGAGEGLHVGEDRVTADVLVVAQPAAGVVAVGAGALEEGGAEEEELALAEVGRCGCLVGGVASAREPGSEEIGGGGVGVGECGGEDDRYGLLGMVEGEEGVYRAPEVCDRNAAICTWLVRRKQF